MSEYNNVVRIGRANAPTAIATPDEDLSARVHESYDHATGLDGVALEIPDGLGDEWAFWQLSPEQAEVIGRRLLEMALPRERTERAMTDAIERAQALLARNSGRRELAYALREVLAEVSELSMLRDVEAGHVEEIAGLRERVRTLEMRLMASRSARKHAESDLADMRRLLGGARAAADTAIEAHLKAAQTIAEHEPRLTAARTARQQAEERAAALEAELAQLKQPASNTWPELEELKRRTRLLDEARASDHDKLVRSVMNALAEQAVKLRASQAVMRAIEDARYELLAAKLTGGSHG